MSSRGTAPRISGIDHLVLATPDLDRASDQIRTLLGWEPALTTEGQGGGLTVQLFSLGNCALELMAPTGPGPMGDRLRAVLADQGEGLASLAFSTADVARVHRRLTHLGMEPDPIVAAASTGADGQTHHWQRTRVGPAHCPGLKLFVLERAAPLVPGTPLPGAEHARVSGLDHVVIRSPNPDRAAALFGARLGLDLRLDQTAPQWGARLQLFRCGDAIVEVAHDLKAGLGDGPDQLWGLSWRVGDADAARARLAGAGLNVSEVRAGRKPGTRVFTVRDRTRGVPTLMVEPAAPRGPAAEPALD